MGRFLTLAVVLVAAFGVLGLGTWWLHARAALDPTMPAAVPEVASAPVRLETHFVREARYAGRIEAARATTLAFEQPGRIVEILVDEGDGVEIGETVAVLDVRVRLAERDRLLAERRSVEARIALAARTEERQSALEGRGFSATQALDEARFTRASLEADAVALDAAIARLDVELDKAVLRAPFAGTVGARHLDDGATVASGTAVLELYETGRLEARVGLPPALAQRLAIGDKAILEQGGRAFAATVTARRPDLDGSTRTTQILLAVEADPAPALGALVTLRVDERVEARGFWVPTSALETGTKGLFRVPLALPSGDDGWERGFAGVVLLYTGVDRAFVDGPVPTGARLVTAGAHRVPVGAAVRLQAE